MNTPTLRAAALATLTALAAAPGVAQADILAVSFSGVVLDINSATGAASVLASSGPSFNSLAKNGSTLWSVETFGARLATINPTTGAATFGATLSGLSSATSIRGLAFSGGVLYGIQNTGGSTSIGPDSLVRIDTATGATVTLGATGVSNMQALAASSTGVLYGWDLAVGLMTINPVTGLATDVSLAAGGGDLQTLAFSPTGVLWGGRSQLFTLDTSTGVASFVTNIGTGTVDMRGMEFTTAVPEPTTALLLAAGLAGLAWRQRRQAA